MEWCSQHPGINSWECLVIWNERGQEGKRRSGAEGSSIEPWIQSLFRPLGKHKEASDCDALEKHRRSTQAALSCALCRGRTTRDLTSCHDYEKVRVYFISSVKSLSRVRFFVTPWIAACQDSLSITNSRSSPKLTSIESVTPSSHLILCHPLLFLPPIPPSIRVFSNESTLRMRWPKYWSFSFNIIPSKEIPGLISFRMDLLDLLAVSRTLKCLLQHYSSKASIVQRSVFFTVQLSHPYMTTGKTIALTRRTFVGKVMSAFEYAI